MNGKRKNVVRLEYRTISHRTVQAFPRTSERYSTSTAVPLAETISMLLFSPIAS